MSATLLVILEAGLFFVFIFLSGFWLSRSGKPYHAVKFNIHKFIGLAAGVFLGYTVYQANHIAVLESLEIAAVAITILIFIFTITAGGLLSTNKSMPIAVTYAHKLLPYLAVLSTTITLYLLVLYK